MLGFVQSWFVSQSNPIGVDFGTDSLRMAQVEATASGEHRLVAAASAQVPTSIANDEAARLEFLTQTLRELLLHGSFRGRRAILGLPASMMELHEMQLPHMEETELRSALPALAREAFSFSTDDAVMRHVVAGPVHESSAEDAVVVMAARRQQVDALLRAAARGRLDVIGMNVEPKALIDCFGHVYRRKNDTDITSCFIDIGSAGARVMISNGGRLLFARSLSFGGGQFDRAVGEALRISTASARLLRIKTCHVSPGDQPAQKRPLNADRAHLETVAHGAPAEVLTHTTSGPGGSESHQQREAVERACEPVVQQLIAELATCRADHHSLFPTMPIDRLIFVGGEARHRDRCLRIASALGIDAQIGDPLVRMGRVSDVGIESGIDRRLPQPAWGIAMGLSMGAPAPTPSVLHPTEMKV